MELVGLKWQLKSHKSKIVCYLGQQTASKINLTTRLEQHQNAKFFKDRF
jgi:hypothetical protein